MTPTSTDTTTGTTTSPAEFIRLREAVRPDAEGVRCPGFQPESVVLRAGSVQREGTLDFAARGVPACR